MTESSGLRRLSKLALERRRKGLVELLPPAAETLRGTALGAREGLGEQDPVALRPPASGGLGKALRLPAPVAGDLSRDGAFSRDLLPGSQLDPIGRHAGARTHGSISRAKGHAQDALRLSVVPPGATAAGGGCAAGLSGTTRRDPRGCPPHSPLITCTPLPSTSIRSFIFETTCRGSPMPGMIPRFRRRPPSWRCFTDSSFASPACNNWRRIWPNPTSSSGSV